jgi:putative aldouronate transport system substrate-binding protein
MKAILRAFLITVLCLTAAAVFAGGQKGSAEAGGGVSGAAPGPFGKYSPEISITSARGVDATLVTDSTKWKDYTDNQWFRDYKDVLGINLSYKWIAPDADSETVRWSTAIASGDVPDFAQVSDNVYKQLYEAGLVADMTEIWDEYASPEFKAMVAETDLAQMTQEGRLMGFPIPGGGMGNCVILFIRQDWLDKVGLPVPKTYEDVIEAARAFNRAKPAGANTIPIGLFNNQGWGANGVWTGFFNAWGAYHDMWLKKDGKLVYSTVQPEVKDALLSMQACFNEGLINKDFMAVNEQQVGEYVANGQVGILWGPNWLTATSYHALNTNDPSNKMVYLYPPSVKGKSYLAQTRVSVPARIFVSARSKYPEAAVKLVNLAQKYEYEDPKYQLDGDVRPNKFNPWSQLITYPDPSETNAAAIADAEKTGVMNPEYVRKYGPGFNEVWESYKKAKASGDPKERWFIETFGGAESSLIIGYNAVQENKLIHSAYLGLPTDTMLLKGTTLTNDLLAAMTEVITGADISVFDKAVKAWYDNGGTQITAEVNDWYQKSGSR